MLARVGPKRVALALALRGAWYAGYRFYYAFGGQIGMIGPPRSPAEFRDINLIGGVIVLTAALTPLIAASASRHGRTRSLIAAIGWIALVGCCTMQ